MNMTRTIGYLFVFIASFAAIAEPVTGNTAPSFSGTTAKGETLTLESLRGKPVILEWTNHLCPYVGKHYRSGNMQRTQRAVTDAGATWVSIISSAKGKQGHVSGAEALEIATKNASYADHIIIDESGEIGRLYAAKTTPHMFMIDADGTLLYQGAIDDIPSASEKSLESATNLVLQAWNEFESGVEISEATTKSYGCTIKY